MRNALIFFPLLLLSLASLVHSQDGAYPRNETGVSATLPPDIVDMPCHTCNSSLCTCDSGFRRRPFGSVEFLFARPHFSEAVAFAEGTQTATSYDVNGQRIDFDYEGGLRSLVGIPLGHDSELLRMQYTFLQGTTSSSGTAPGPGQFIVDPFGNLVGSVTIIDPSDARYTPPPPGTMLSGGDLIRTTTTVDAHVYDIDYSTTWDGHPWLVQFDIGARIAKIDQQYESAVTLAGAPLATGTFSADFTGAGPRVGLEGRRCLGSQRPLWFFASTHVSLLVGEHVASSANSLGGGAFVAGQATSQRRTIPVLETEMGATWQVTDCFEVSAGWLFHAWHDLGASGGTFGGFFVGSDDANTMSFDGLLLRAEFSR